MSLALASPPRQPSHPARKRFTREEAHRMSDLGLLRGRYELVDGDVIDKMGQNPPHASTFRKLQAWLFAIFSADQLRFQLPVEVAPKDQILSEPEPDVAIVTDGSLDYESRHPRGDELVALIEIADTSADFDRSVKARLYARAGVAEFWVIDLNRRAVIVHRDPGPEEYGDVRLFGEQEATSFACRPDKRIAIASLLPAPRHTR
jgi:Uma2 family endonuclease